MPSFDRLRLSTRLTLAILPIVVLVMGALGVWFVSERQRVLVPEMQQQTRAYARALDIAFEFGVRDLDSARIAALLDRTASSSRVTGIRLYDAAGRLEYRSSAMVEAPPVPAASLARVLGGTSETFFERRVGDEQVFTVLRAIREPVEGSSASEPRGRVLGAVEVVQPYSLLLAEVRRFETELAAATLLLLFTVTVTLAYMSRRTVSRPLEQLVAAARALGEGESGTRVPRSLGSAEPNALAREFNTMAERLSDARRELLEHGAERLRLERRLAEAERLATVGTLAAGLAHEIGAPLNVISGRAEMLLGQEGTSPATARHLESIVAQSGRITRTVRSLLDYARKPARQDELVRVDSIVRGTLDLLEPECQRAQAVVQYRPSADAMVLGDSDQLQQVVTNLLLNALQAMDGLAGTRGITVRVDRTVTPRAGKDVAEDVLIVIDDTGPGLAPELDGRLFTPFATTKPSGTGLGLVVARGIVQDHGGALDGTTRTDGVRGARFVIRLPIAPPSSPSATSPAGTASVSGAPASVLVSESA